MKIKENFINKTLKLIVLFNHINLNQYKYKYLIEIKKLIIS